MQNIMINVDVRGTKKKKEEERTSTQHSKAWNRSRFIQHQLLQYNANQSIQRKKNHKLQNKWKLEDQNPNLLFKGKRAQLKEREISFF